MTMIYICFDPCYSSSGFCYAGFLAGISHSGSPQGSSEQSLPLKSESSTNQKNL